MSRRDAASESRLARWLTLRRLEAVTLATTTAAFAITVLLVTTGRATELNWVAAWLLTEAGWVTAGVVGIAAEAGGFAALRRWSDDVPRGVLGGGVCIAAVGVADLAVNLWLLAQVGVPPVAQVYWAGVAPGLVAVALAGVRVRPARPAAGATAGWPSAASSRPWDVGRPCRGRRAGGPERVDCAVRGRDESIRLGCPFGRNYLRRWEPSQST